MYNNVDIINIIIIIHTNNIVQIMVKSVVSKLCRAILYLNVVCAYVSTKSHQYSVKVFCVYILYSTYYVHEAALL